MILGAALIFAAAGFVVALAFAAGLEERRAGILARFERDLLRPGEQNEDVLYLVGFDGMLEKERKRLEGLDIKPQDFLLFKLTLATLCVVLGSLSGWVAPGIGAAALVVYASNFAVQRLRAARRKQVESQALLDMLYDLAATLRAAPQFTDALEQARPRLAGRLAVEIDRVLEALKTGKSVEEALLDFADRTDSSLVRAWAENIMFARRAGADMADVCMNTAEKLRDRLRFGKEIRALAAGAKGTVAGIAGILGLSVFLQVSSGQMADVVSSPVGRTVVGLAVLVMAAGTFWIWSVIEGEVEK